MTQTHVILSDWRDPLDPDSEAQMIFTQLLQSRDELQKKLLETKEPQKDSPDSCNPENGEQISVKGTHTSSTASEKAVTTKLLEVIDEIKKAHESIEEKAITKS